MPTVWGLQLLSLPMMSSTPPLFLRKLSDVLVTVTASTTKSAAMAAFARPRSRDAAMTLAATVTPRVVWKGEELPAAGLTREIGVFTMRLAPASVP